jgi:hypothetical protein
LNHVRFQVAGWAGTGHGVGLHIATLVLALERKLRMVESKKGIDASS